MGKKRHRILLIEPPYYRLFKDTYSLDRYPLSLGYLAGAVKKNTDWEVMVCNSDFTPEIERIKVSYLAGRGFYNYLDHLKDLSRPIWSQTRKVISDYRPEVVGITATSQNYAAARIVAKFVKEIDKEVIVIVGGPHASMVGEDLLDCPDIDIGVRGEGELTIVELLNAIGGQKGFNDIKGISHRKDGRIMENPPRVLINDLNSLSFPHESAPQVLKDYDRYPMVVFQHIFATRGCPYNCFFCGSRNIWSRKTRFRSPENVIEEIEGLREKGLERVIFEDDIFGVTKEYIKDLCNALIKHCRGLRWGCEMHVKLVDEENISLMKKAGCDAISLGIESGNNEILSQMRKGFTIEAALQACKIIKRNSIILGTFFIVGFPRETEDTLRDTISAMKRVKCDGVIYSIFTPYPGTEAFEFCKEKGLIGDDYDVSLYNHQSPANSFCLNIRPEKFRILASRIEKMVDRKDRIYRIKELVSWHTISRVKELGIRESLKKGGRVLAGKW